MTINRDNSPLSEQSKKELEELKKELHKSNPNPERINFLLNGDKYSNPIS
jgi:hypothetical protein